MMKERVLFWSPRIIAILAILFMMMFSLDCFEGPLKENLVCFFMHNIPAFIITAILILAWRWEFVGGFLFITVSIAGAIYFNGFGKNWGVLPVMAPFLLAGILFILYHVLYHNKNID